MVDGANIDHCWVMDVKTRHLLVTNLMWVFAFFEQEDERTREEPEKQSVSEKSSEIRRAIKLKHILVVALVFVLFCSFFGVTY